jgi:hypothetical protein
VTVTLSELTTPLTRAEAEAAIYAACASRGLTTTTWKPGAVTRTIIYAFSVLVAAVSLLQALIAEGGFLALATGDWLTLLARYVYDVERSTGSQAAFTQRFDNAGAGVYTGVAGDLIIACSVNGKTYRNTAAYSIGAFAADVLIPFAADEVGSASSAAPATITTLVTTLLGVTTTNPDAVVGDDADDDETVRLLCREKTGTLSPNGPRDAYAYMARTTTLNGVNVGVTRVRSIADGSGNVDVYLATPSGGVTGTSGDPTTALGAVHEKIQRNVVPLAVRERTHTATALPIAVTYEYWLLATTGLADADIEAAIAARLGTFMAARPIGGDLLPGETVGRVYVSAIEGAIASTFPAQTLRVSVTLPVADVDCATTEVPVLDTVTGTVHQVSEDVI